MLADELRRAVEASPRVELSKVSALLWKAYAAGHVTEGQATDLSALIEARRALPAPQKPVQRRLGSRPRSPASMERRRRWAASGALPPTLAAKFTLGEQAALAVVAAEHRKHGDCRLTHQEVADVAGVGLTTVKNALRAARALHLLDIHERRLAAFRNASNVVRITDRSWLSWLRLRGGVKSAPRSPTQTKRPAVGLSARRSADRRDAASGSLSSGRR